MTTAQTIPDIHKYKYKINTRQIQIQDKYKINTRQIQKNKDKYKYKARESVGGWVDNSSRQCQISTGFPQQIRLSLHVTIAFRFRVSKQY